MVAVISDRWTIFVKSEEARTFSQSLNYPQGATEVRLGWRYNGNLRGPKKHGVQPNLSWNVDYM